MPTLEEEISRRRTFAIISHPDAGKTTLTEKFLLYGGAIAQAGQVKGKKNTRAATSDWMEIEKQRGISVTSSVMQFQHNGFCINILDTPGHQDFSEDTYRTLMAADSAVMVIDGAKGVEPQTRKLFKVCALRHIPIFTFINKMDRETRDPLELCEEVERELGIDTYAMNWPIGCGKEFQGVYDREKQRILFFSGETKGKKVNSMEVALEDPTLDEMLGVEKAAKLRDEVELLGAGRDFDMKAVRNGTLSPVFFGSALTTFGVEPFLEEFLRMTTPPLPRVSDQGEVDVFSPDFSAFVFKIQANMNKAHRDRLAFMRICSGKFERDTEYYHVQSGKKLRLSQPQTMMAAEREIVEEAYAGDIIVAPKLAAETGDTLSITGKVEAAAFKFPNSQYRIAIEAENRGDEEKLYTFIEKACKADPTMSIDRDEETGQTIISAVGEAQVSVLLNRLEDRTKVVAKSVPIRIPYRETIRRTASAQGRHKKQTGGAGQYGDCWLRVEPLIGPDGTSEGYEFADEVVGGRIPRSLIPAVDKGVQETMKDGIIAGYPLTGIRVAVYDGSYHSVDSNEMAFRAAARIGLRKACADADPVVLEPIEEITVTIPESYAGAVMGDISASRGRVTGMETDERGDTVVIAQAPLAELTDYSTRLRSITRGTGDFTMKSAGYEQVPYDVQAKLVERYEEGRAK